MGLACPVFVERAAGARWSLDSAGILETPTFAHLVEQHKLEQPPALEVFRRHPKPIFLSPLVRLSEQAPYYIFTAFVFTYGTPQLKLSRDLLLNAVTLFAVVEVFLIPFAGYLFDRIERKLTYLIGVTLMSVIWGSSSSRS